MILATLLMTTGCTGFLNEDRETTSPSTQSPTPTLTVTETHRSTDEINPTSTSSPSETQSTQEKYVTTENNKRLEQRRRYYREFADDYVQGVTGGNRSTTFGLAEIDARNRSVRFFHRAPTNNTSQYLLEQYVILYGYQRIIETYPKNEEPFTDEDKSWIPRTVNVTVRTQDGQLYERAYIKYDWGLARAKGNISERKYHFLYIGEAEPGPAHPEEGI
jgi:hypothetical protein